MPPDVPPAAGVAFPATGGRRSSTATARAVLAAAVAEADPGLAATVERTSDWRRGYVEAFGRLTATTAADPGAAVAVARRGLAAAREHVVLAGGGQSPDVPLHDALSGDRPAAAAPPATLTVAGSGQEPAGLELPVRGSRLREEALVSRLAGWEAAGVVEPSVTAAVRGLVEDPARLDLRGTTVLLLGAGAELGPYLRLVRWGAHVVAVDLPRPALWRRLLAGVRPTAGRLTVPVREPLPTAADDDRVAGAAGLDLLAELPAVAAWLGEHVAAAPGPVWLGTHVYADGAAHALATLAADAVAVHLAQARPDLGLGLLATPTDAFVVPEAAVEHSRVRLRDGAGPARVLQRVARAGTGGRLFAPNYRGLLDGGHAADGSPRLVGLHDALVPQQGPGYALAKRLQRWRATTWQADGRGVSVNVAPATRTRSVLRNRALAAAYAGAHRFGVEVFDPPTSATLMAALLVADLRPAAHGDAAPPAAAHPDETLWHGAAHGGLWRTPWAPRSVLGLAVGLGALPRGR